MDFNNILISIYCISRPQRIIKEVEMQIEVDLQINLGSNLSICPYCYYIRDHCKCNHWKVCPVCWKDDCICPNNRTIRLVDMQIKTLEQVVSGKDILHTIVDNTLRANQYHLYASGDDDLKNLTIHEVQKLYLDKCKQLDESKLQLDVRHTEIIRDDVRRLEHFMHLNHFSRDGLRHIVVQQSGDSANFDELAADIENKKACRIKNADPIFDGGRISKEQNFLVKFQVDKNNNSKISFYETTEQVRDLECKYYITLNERGGVTGFDTTRTLQFISQRVLDVITSFLF